MKVCHHRSKRPLACVGEPADFARRWLHKLLVVLAILSSSAVHAMPQELFEGVVRFELESGNHFDALVLMDQAHAKRDPVSYAAALKGFNMDSGVEALMEQISSADQELSPNDYFQIGRIEYDSDRCVPALKAFKHLKNKLGLEEKQEWAFYRANCFIKLGSDVRAAQVLSDILSGIWVSHAYFNLAMSYAETSSVKTKSLVALRVAASLNAGETLAEKELNDRIYYAAGAIYLNEEKPDLATEFFKKVNLDSATAPQALYLNGVANLQLNDFRAATQNWFSVKKYPVIHTGVAESLLAIPYAYERSGYVSQALEAYLEASSTFEKELQTIDKVSALLAEHGFQRVLVDESELEGLEWFLAKDVARNTQRAAYYSFLAEDEAIYDAIELLLEMKMLRESLSFWASQLKVYKGSLTKKQRDFASRSAAFKPAQVKAEIKEFGKRSRELRQSPEANPKLIEQLQLDRIPKSLDALSQRLAALQNKIAKGRDRLKSQLSQSQALNKRIVGGSRELDDLIRKLDDYITDKALARMVLLKQTMQANFERSEQGLIHILENIAVSNTSRRNLLDGRYQ